MGAKMVGEYCRRIRSELLHSLGRFRQPRRKHALIDDSLRSEFLVARAKRLLADSRVVEEGLDVVIQILGEQQLSATNGVGDVGLMIEFDPDFKDGMVWPTSKGSYSRS